ncbi:hypothetical protein RSSM_01287 [Rhodopirellula sallentina SM41]|uniref:Uncharacterized protein n=1 Tax=Rhodopirellula sallentina SM41 TaxID=1263870 RepID=M5U794_9BACT|nr:hypothetical protein RSSM_01287 [Rhodopirellula sallentina SM41]
MLFSGVDWLESFVVIGAIKPLLTGVAHTNVNAQSIIAVHSPKSVNSPFPVAFERNQLPVFN